ncbi:hypothetical protein M8J76_012737 [Diaphorina citri]|nr:hypothetical protein M8J76_012737 [Diaphorina citri]
MERYMTQILSALSRKPASVSTKQSEVTSEAGPSSLPTASCLLSPQTAPSQPAPAALSPPVRPNSCPPFPACSSSSLAPSIGGSYIWPGFCSLCWSLSAVGCRIPLHDPSSGPVGSFITHTLILDIMDSTMVDTRVQLIDLTWGFLPGTLRRFPQKMMKKNPTLRTRLAFPLHSSHLLPLLGNGSLPFLTLTRNLLLREFLAKSLVVLLGIGLGMRCLVL